MAWKPAASSYCVRSVRFVGLLSMCERIGTRLPLWKAENPDLQLYFVTLTVKDGKSLQERFNHLVKAERRYKRQRKRNAEAGQKFVSMQKPKGVFVPLSSNEAKTQANGIHTHDLAMLRSSDAHQLSREWEALTGDSFIVDVRPMYRGNWRIPWNVQNTLWSFQTWNCQTICMPTKHWKANAW